MDQYYRDLGVDPNEPRTLRNRSTAAIRAGDFARARGHLNEALVDYRAGLAIHDRLAAADASNATWQRDLIAVPE